MHAFDLAKLAGPEIRVRRAKPGETIATLDGVQRKLDSEMLVIADRDRAQAIAGVMGGAGSEVSSSTRRVVFESAYFKPASVRRTSKRLNLKTEASARFERGADIGAPVIALQRLAALMDQIGSGQTVGSHHRRVPRRRGSRTLFTCAARGSRRSWVSRCPIRTSSGSCAAWESPSPADVGRLGRRRSHLPRRSPARGRSDRGSRPPLRIRQARGDLSGRHRAGAAARPAHPARPAGAQNSDGGRSVRSRHLRVHRSEGRGGVRDRRQSASRGARQPAVGEIRHAPSLAHSRPRRRRRAQSPARTGQRAAVRDRDAVCGRRRDGGRLPWRGRDPSAPLHWSAGGRPVDFFDVKGLVELLAHALDVPLRFEPADEPFLVPGQTAAIVSAGGPAVGSTVGLAGQIASHAADARGLSPKDRVYVAELNLDLLDQARAASSDATRSLPAPSVRRPRSVDRRLGYLACGNHSWHHSGGRTRCARAAHRRRVLRSLSGQRRAGGCGQHLGAVDVSGRRSHVDRRGSATERRKDSCRAWHEHVQTSKSAGHLVNWIGQLNPINDQMTR